MCGRFILAASLIGFCLTGVARAASFNIANMFGLSVPFEHTAMGLELESYTVDATKLQPKLRFRMEYLRQDNEHSFASTSHLTYYLKLPDDNGVPTLRPLLLVTPTIMHKHKEDEVVINGGVRLWDRKESGEVPILSVSNMLLSLSQYSVAASDLAMRAHGDYIQALLRDRSRTFHSKSVYVLTSPELRFQRKDKTGFIALRDIEMHELGGRDHASTKALHLKGGVKGQYDAALLGVKFDLNMGKRQHYTGVLKNANIYNKPNAKKHTFVDVFGGLDVWEQDQRLHILANESLLELYRGWVLKAVAKGDPLSVHIPLNRRDKVLTKITSSRLDYVRAKLPDSTYAETATASVQAPIKVSGPELSGEFGKTLINTIYKNNRLNWVRTDNPFRVIYDGNAGGDATIKVSGVGEHFYLKTSGDSLRDLDAKVFGGVKLHYFNDGLIHAHTLTTHYDYSIRRISQVSVYGSPVVAYYDVKKRGTVESLSNNDATRSSLVRLEAPLVQFFNKGRRLLVKGGVYVTYDKSSIEGETLELSTKNRAYCFSSDVSCMGYITATDGSTSMVPIGKKLRNRERILSTIDLDSLKKSGTGGFSVSP